MKKIKIEKKGKDNGFFFIPSDSNKETKMVGKILNNLIKDCPDCGELIKNYCRKKRS